MYVLFFGTVDYDINSSLIRIYFYLEGRERNMHYALDLSPSIETGDT